MARLDERNVPLPRGTRVLLRVELEGEGGFVHRQASLATVHEVSNNTYVLRTPSGRTLQAQRDQITVQRKELLDDLGRRHVAFDELKDDIVYAAVVGSRAWGLAGPDSDEDVRGCFVLPFERHVSLWDAPDEIKDPTTDAAYWEIEKLVHQGLRGDANTLECLWTPIVRHATPLGERLRERRAMFVSMNVLGSFGRYAESQLTKIERSLARNAALAALLEGIESKGLTTTDEALKHLVEVVPGDEKHRRRELTAMIRSTFDRGLVERCAYDAIVEAVHEGRRGELEPAPHRPKNAYNLLRLLHSCLSWLRTGEPMIEVTGPLKETLRAIKEQALPIEETLRLARATAAEIDEVAPSAVLPEAPDYEAADALLTECRTARARRSLAVPGPMNVDPYRPTILPVALTPDVDVASMRRFLEAHGQPPRGRTIQIALSGAHAYGFPSVDSDLDVKGAFVAHPRDALGFAGVPAATDYLGIFDGREYDLTLNELGKTAQSIIAGNGNYIERFLGPYPLLTTEVGERMAALVVKNLSRRVVGHYRGFMRSIQKRYLAEAEQGVRKAKRLLYVYRTALSGVHLLTTGELRTDATALAAQYGFEGVAELARIKAAQEVVSLPAGADAPYLEDFERLDAALTDAEQRSVLPEDPTAADALEAFVVELRIGRVDGPV